MYGKIVFAFFNRYISRIIKNDFSAFTYNKVQLNGRAVLLIANHFSWWDGFLMFHLNKIYFRKKFHVMVTEENYKKVSFLKYLGAFPVNRSSKSLLDTLNQAGQLLNDPDNLVLIFPQGKLYSNHTEDIVFEKGLINLINSSNKKFQYVFASTFVDYFEKRKPSLYCYLDTWEGAEFLSLQLLKSVYNKHYESSRQQQSRIIR